MRYLDFRKNFTDFCVFSLDDIRSIEEDFHRRRLTEWQDKGYIKKVIKGYYIFSDLLLDEKTVFEIANRIYSPSYISFEMAFNFYGIIPEGVYGITSASTRKTMTFKTQLGVFIYHRIQPRLYFGFEFQPNGKRLFKIASLEKALLDYFYLHSDLRQDDDFERLRLNKEVVREKINFNRLIDFVNFYANKSLKKRILTFWDYLNHA